MQHSKQSSFCNHALVQRVTRPVNGASAGTVRAGLYVLPGFPMEEYALFAAVLHEAGEACGGGLNVEVLSSNGGFVQGSCSAVVQTRPLAEVLSGLDYLVVFGGHLSKPGSNQHFRAALQVLRRKGCQIAAVGGAALALTRAGVFDSGSCAVHWQNREVFSGLMSSVNPTDKVCSVNDGDWSSCGKTGALDLALHVVSGIYGQGAATRLAQAFIHTRLSDARSTQNGEVLHAALSASSVVNKAIALFRKNLENPLSMSDAARLLGASPRRIERHFRFDDGDFFFRLRRCCNDGCCRSRGRQDGGRDCRGRDCRGRDCRGRRHRLNGVFRHHDVG